MKFNSETMYSREGENLGLLICIEEFLSEDLENFARVDREKLEEMMKILGYGTILILNGSAEVCFINAENP